LADHISAFIRKGLDEKEEGEEEDVSSVAFYDPIGFRAERVFENGKKIVLCINGSPKRRFSHHPAVVRLRSHPSVLQPFKSVSCVCPAGVLSLSGENQC
jgi:hypothetical protein